MQSRNLIKSICFFLPKFLKHSSKPIKRVVLEYLQINEKNSRKVKISFIATDMNNFSTNNAAAALNIPAEAALQTNNEISRYEYPLTIESDDESDSCSLSSIRSTIRGDKN